MTPMLVYMALTFAAAPPTAEDPRMTFVKRHGGTFADQKEIARLVAQLGDDSFARRKDAAKRLREFGPQALPALMRVTYTADLEMNQAAAPLIKLFEPEDKKLPAVIRSLLTGADGSVMADIQRLGNHRVRALAFETVAKVGMNRSMMLEVMKGTGDANGEVASRAGDALYENPSPGLDAVLALAKHEHPRVRESAVRLLHKHPNQEKRSVPALVAALKDEDAGVRRVAANAMWMYPGEESIRALTEALKDPDDPDPYVAVGVASIAAGSLTMNRTQPDRVLRILLSVLKDGPKQTRQGVYRAMSHWAARDKSVVKMLLPHIMFALDDKDAYVRGLACGWLKEHAIRGPDVIPGLLRVLKAKGSATDKDLAFSWSNAAYALGAIGPDAAPAVPRLVELVGIKGLPGRDNAVDALARIGKDTPEIRAALRCAAEELVPSTLRDHSLEALRSLDKRAKP